MMTTFIGSTAKSEYRKAQIAPTATASASEGGPTGTVSGNVSLTCNPKIKRAQSQSPRFVDPLLPTLCLTFRCFLCVGTCIQLEINLHFLELSTNVCSGLHPIHKTDDLSL